MLVSIPDNAPNEMMDVVLEDLLSDIDQGIAELQDSQRWNLEVSVEPKHNVSWLFWNPVEPTASV